MAAQKNQRNSIAGELKGKEGKNIVNMKFFCTADTMNVWGMFLNVGDKSSFEERVKLVKACIQSICQG